MNLAAVSRCGGPGMGGFDFDTLHDGADPHDLGNVLASRPASITGDNAANTSATISVIEKLVVPPL